MIYLDCLNMQNTKQHDGFSGVFYAAIAIIAILLLTSAFLFAPLEVLAESREELQSRIRSYGEQIREIDAEIARYQKELDQVGAEKDTLENAVRQLDISRNQIAAKVNSAQTQINSTELTITDLNREILAAKESIELGEGALAESIRRLDEAESRTLIETLLVADSVNNLWDEIDAVEQFQSVMNSRIRELSAEKNALESARAQSETKQGELLAQRSELAAQKRSLDVNRKEKGSLLAQTNAQESNYQKLIVEKQAAREQFETQLKEFESQLAYTSDPSLVPPAGEGILKWPLDNVRITQHFGNTEFARSGAYNGTGHNGVDFGAPVGTPVRSSLGGVVIGSGNTDLFPGCFSYGKWALIRHGNGLASLYAHLSDIAVPVGQSVATGEVIGYSGNTGYSTGPHLHFTVFQSSEVRIVRLGDVKTITNCPNAEIPVAPLQAYLNPLDYL